MTYNAFMPPATILLIDNNRIVRIIHNNVLKSDIRNKYLKGWIPCFDSHTILCWPHCAVSYVNALHILFWGILANAPNADAVARTTYNSSDIDVPRSSPHGYAIISSADTGIENINVVDVSGVNSVSVWAISWWCYCNALDGNVLTIFNFHVETFAVE